MKRVIFFIVLLFAIVFSVNAQVILMDSDESRARSEVECEIPFIPTLGVTYDQYAPLAEGSLFLCCLGVVYLLKNRQKNE